MARVRAPAVVVCVGVLALAWGRERPGTALVEAPSFAKTAITDPVFGDVVVVDGPAPDWRARSVAVRDACDLDARVVCDEVGCVGVLVAPDPDVRWGWARLGAASPRFVASTVLRDLGVPAGAMPCGQAIALLAGDGVLAVDGPGATEVWCATDGSDAARGLCAEAAGVGFDGARVRRFAH